MSHHSRRRNPRSLALSMAGLALALLAFAAGCESQPELAPAPRASREIPDVEEVRAHLMRSAQKWYSMEADCTVVIRSQSIRSRGNVDQLRRGKFYLEKTGDTPYSKVKLVAPEGASPRVQLVGDGERYEMMVYGDRASGRYDAPLPQNVRIPLMPDDLADALDWPNLFMGRVQVPRVAYLPGTYCIDSLLPVEEPYPRLVASNTLFFPLGTMQPQIMRKYQPDGSLRSEARFGSIQMVKGPEDETVNLPSQLFLLYPTAATVVRLTFTDIRLNTTLPADTFDVSQ